MAQSQEEAVTDTPGRERYAEMGRAGTQSFHGIIAEDFNVEFQGQRAIRTYEKMRKTDATVAATLRALKLPILAAGRTIESSDPNDGKANEIAEFVRKGLFETLEGGFHSTLREAMGHLDFGFYYFEKVWEVAEGGEVRLKRLAPRLPSAHYLWIQSKNPGEPGVTQMLKGSDPTIGTSQPEIPMSKLVLFTHCKEGDNHEGVSVLRSAYKHWFMKDTLYRIDGIKHERGAGVLKIMLPEGAGASDKADAEELGENFKVGEATYIVVPNKNWSIELMTTGIADQSAALMESVKHHDRMIVLNVLAQFLDLGSAGGGSYSLSRDQSSFFGMALKAIAKDMDNVFNEQVIREMVDLNFGEQEEYPRMVTAEIGDVDFAETSAMLKTLTDAGLLDKSPEVRSWVRKTFNLPEMSAEDFEDQDAEDEANAPPEPEMPMIPGMEPMEPEKAMPEKKARPAPQEAELAEGKFFRDLTLAEKRVKFAEIKGGFDEGEDDVEAELSAATDIQKRKLLKDAGAIIDAGTVGAVAGIALVGIGSMAGTLKDAAKKALETGKVMAANEIGGKIPVTTSFTKNVIGGKIDLLVAARQQAIENAVKARMIDLMNNEVGKTAAISEIERLFDSQASVGNRIISGKVVVENFNEGRALTFDVNPDLLHALQRSEILDGGTCPMCATIDGRVLSTNDPFTNIGEIHGNCRGVWVGILKTDTELPKTKPLPKSILSRFGTVEGMPSVNDFAQLKRPVVAKGSRLEQAIMDGKVQAGDQT